VTENKICESTECLKADTTVAFQAYGWRLPLKEVWAGVGMKNWHCSIWYLGQVLWCAVCKHKIQKHSL